MQHKIFLIPAVVFLISCKSNPVPVPVESLPETAPAVMAPPVSEPVASESLKELQDAVYALEDKLYGVRKLGGLGLYGELKACKRKLASPQFGGSGSMMWSDSLDRLTDKEDELKDEKPKERLERFRAFRSILQKRADDFSARIEACKAELAAKEMDGNQPNRVTISEVPKTSVERAEIHQYLCGFVRQGASLQTFMQQAFARGWLWLGDYRMNQNLIPVSLKDSKGSSRDNALLFNGWKLAFDRQRMTVGDVFHDGLDAKLTAWAVDRKADVPNGTACLSAPDGQWNP